MIVTFTGLSVKKHCANMPRMSPSQRAYQSKKSCSASTERIFLKKGTEHLSPKLRDMAAIIYKGDGRIIWPADVLFDPKSP
jgi:hypothetical protein